MMETRPNSAVANGASAAPRSRCTAKRTPFTTLAAAPAWASRSTSREGRHALSATLPAMRRARRHPTSATGTSKSTTTPTRPAPSTSASASSPPDGSARRARPSGKIGDARYAASTATSAPATTIAAARVPATTVRWARVVPSAAKSSPSRESVATTRTNAWPTTRRPVTAATSANRLSASTYGLVTCANVAASRLLEAKSRLRSGKRLRTSASNDGMPRSWPRNTTCAPSKLTLLAK